MPVDNELYNRLSDTWWDDAGFLNILQSALNPARVAFLERELRSHFGGLQGLRLLDVGCGGGLLAEELAHRGCSVTGVDPSEGSLAVARDHAARAGLQIEYQSGVAESLEVVEGFGDRLPAHLRLCRHLAGTRAILAQVAQHDRVTGLDLITGPCRGREDLGVNGAVRVS